MKKTPLRYFCAWAIGAAMWPKFWAYAKVCAISAAGFAVVYVTVWQIHFTVGTNINPSLPDNGYYQASPEYKAILAEGRSGSLLSFPVMLRDSYRFVGHYQKGVPKLNLCKAEENGSPAYLWPAGARTINYRWERSGEKTKYLYLVVNPVVWLLSLVGVLLAGGFWFSHLFGPDGRASRSTLLLTTFLAMYAGYMGAVGSLSRVMYLYHYFIPLVLGFCLLGLALVEIRRFWLLPVTPPMLTGILSALAAAVVVSFNYFSPFTYYQPISDKELAKRAFLPAWDLHCVNCSLTNDLAVPVCDPKIKPSPDVSISGVRAESGTQDWGDFKQDHSVEDQDLVVGGVRYPSGIGTHAASTLRFRLDKRYKTFSAKVGIPDYVKEKSGKGSIVFEVQGDGRTLWRSKLLHAGDAPESIEVTVESVTTLTLVAADGGDGIDNDHACWLSPQLGQ